MADCSQFAESVVELGMAIASKEGIKSFDDVAFEIIKLIPELNRDGIANAFIEVQESRRKTATDLQKKLLAIYSEPKLEKETQEKVKELLDFIETGDFPSEVKTAKPISIKLEQLRKTRDNLRKWLETGDPVVKDKLSKEIVELNEKLESGEVDLGKKTGKFHQDVQVLKNEIKELKDAIKGKNAQDKLISKIETLQSHLEAKTLPEKKKPSKIYPDANTKLRLVILDLENQLSNSDPARKIRLEKSIRELRDKLKYGVIQKPEEYKEESKEIEDLIYKKEILKRELQDEIRNKKPKGVWDKVGIGWDLSRLGMTTGEFSFSLRQGGIYALTHPLKWKDAMVEAFKAFGDARSLYELNKKIFNDKDAPLMQKSGLFLIREGMSLSQTEEIIMNYWQDKLPVIRNFQRAAVGFMNKARFDLFKSGNDYLSKTGRMTLEQAEVWSNYINNMSGRGNLKFGAVDLRPSALALNRAMFSPYFVSSRFQMLLGTPLYYKLGSKNTTAVRKMIAKEYARLGLGLSAIIGLGMMMGADIEEDPRSANFGKMIFGNRRLDFAMGHAQALRFLSQMITGTTKTGSGIVNPIREKYVFLQDGKIFQQNVKMKYGSTDAMDVLANFGRSKLSPQFGFVMNFITGQKMSGEEVTLLNNTTQMLYPITYGDVYDVMQEDGVPTNTALSVLTFLGMGLQTYENKSTENKPKKSKY